MQFFRRVMTNSLRRGDTSGTTLDKTGLESVKKIDGKKTELIVDIKNTIVYAIQTFKTFNYSRKPLRSTVGIGSNETHIETDTLYKIV